MSHRILVADDDHDNRTIVKDALDAAGYRVIMASNGQEALDLAVKEKPEPDTAGPFHAQTEGAGGRKTHKAGVGGMIIEKSGDIYERRF